MSTMANKCEVHVCMIHEFFHHQGARASLREWGASLAQHDLGKEFLAEEQNQVAKGDVVGCQRSEQFIIIPITKLCDK